MVNLLGQELGREVPGSSHPHRPSFDNNRACRVRSVRAYLRGKSRAGGQRKWGRSREEWPEHNFHPSDSIGGGGATQFK